MNTAHSVFRVSAFKLLSNCKHLLLHSCGFPTSPWLVLYIFGLLGTHFLHCLLLNGSRSKIAFANCNSLSKCLIRRLYSQNKGTARKYENNGCHCLTKQDFHV